MSTLVKLVRESGLDGRIVHKHGESDWHPAHRAHKGDAHSYDANSHEVNDAAHPTNAKDVLKTADLRKTYAAMMQGKEQPEFLAIWRAKLAARKVKAPSAVAQAAEVAANVEFIVKEIVNDEPVPEVAPSA